MRATGEFSLENGASKNVTSI